MTSKYALHAAIKDGDIRRVHDLLQLPESEVDRNLADRSGYTPLMLAAASPHSSADLTSLLISNGADLHLSLRAALGVGDPKIVKRLIDAGADIKYSVLGGYDALIDCVHSRDIKTDANLIPLLKLLVAEGAALDGHSSYGESALSVVSNFGRFDAVKLLLEAGAPKRRLELGLLSEAVVFGTLEDLAPIFESGFSLEERDRSFRTPFLLAVQIGDIAKAELLLRHGANRDATGNCGKPHLFHAIENHQNEMLRWLLEIGADIRQTDKFGGTALSTAAESNNTEAVAMLIDACADVNVETRAGNALRHASSREAALILLGAGADPSELQLEARRDILGFSAEPDDDLLDISPEEFEFNRVRRFGTTHPEQMNNPCWDGMIRSGITAYQANARFDAKNLWEDSDENCEDGKTAIDRCSPQTTYEPTWCAQRFGQSLTFLLDGRIVEIGGEHEDYYDPEFCIYNDVFVHNPDGSLAVYGYPAEVFPPTDFHTATIIGNHIYIIGSLGYKGTRVYGHTPVYRLNINCFEIEKLETTGDCPGWVYKHRAIFVNGNQIRIFGGKVVDGIEESERHLENNSIYTLDTDLLAWTTNLK